MMAAEYLTVMTVECSYVFKIAAFRNSQNPYSSLACLRLNYACASIRTHVEDISKSEPSPEAFNKGAAWRSENAKTPLVYSV